MSDWISCPSCNLRHSRRPSGICPKCGQSVEGAAAPDVYEAHAAPVAATPLPSLAQSARADTLNSARGILFAIGILTLLANGFMFAKSRNEIDEVFAAEIKKLGPNFVPDEVKVAEAKAGALSTVRMIYGGAAALGALFCVFGGVVKQFPVPVTITSLVLYIGATAVFGVLDPSSLARGAIIKIIMTVGLFKSVQAALAYQKELEQGPAEERAA